MLNFLWLVLSWSLLRLVVHLYQTEYSLPLCGCSTTYQTCTPIVVSNSSARLVLELCFAYWCLKLKLVIWLYKKIYSFMLPMVFILDCQQGRKIRVYEHRCGEESSPIRDQVDSYNSTANNYHRVNQRRKCTGIPSTSVLI